MSYLVKAIKKLKPSAEFSFTDDDYSTVKWDVLEGKAPTQAQIDVAIEQIKAEEAQAEATKAAQRQAILDRLGLTAEEAQLLLGGN
jgi:acyl-CoA reductase-like NAD-dependent aldehyde dehydrogenase